MEPESTAEIWQIEAGGQVYEAPFPELAEWIHQGSLLRIDRVRKANLRWIEAGKVPALIEFFNAKDAAAPPPPPITASTTERLGVAGDPVPISSGSFVNSPLAAHVSRRPDVCALHPDTRAVLICDTCANVFCRACPNTYGSVKICPFCGAMCKSIADVEKVRKDTIERTQGISGGFGFGDLARALAYPFKFKMSLFMGALMFMFFSLGQSAMAFGGVFMLAGVIMSFMLANTLTFGVLANTVESFTQGKLNSNFMPSFDDFSLWDDVVHPFFLSIGVYISSFGPLIAVALIGFFMIPSPAQKQMDPLQADAARAISPELPNAANRIEQGSKLKDLINQTNDGQRERISAIEEGRVPETKPGAEEDAKFEKLNEMIQQQRRSQLESALGKTPETRAKDQEALVARVLGYGAVFLLVAGIALLWGLFYFPAACAVAGYTRSFTATLDPTVGFDTIRRLGVSYFLILLMGLLLLIASGAVSSVVGTALAAFDLPGIGNMPAKALTSIFGFYFSVVFSCVLGYALYKAADRLELSR